MNVSDMTSIDWVQITFVFWMQIASLEGLELKLGRLPMDRRLAIKDFGQGESLGNQWIVSANINGFDPRTELIKLIDERKAAASLQGIK